ncbi:MAG: hypothetical protein FGM52_08785 [Mycobacterium sp.]|nr:hypothetical protein [Mycobacterium sp.]
MFSARLTRQVALVAGAAAILGAGALTACAKEEKPAETKPSTSAPSVSPSEKAQIGSWSPTVKAPPAPTALPGNIKTGQ